MSDCSIITVITVPVIILCQIVPISNIEFNTVIMWQLLYILNIYRITQDIDRR